jgi:hypothetical protein
MTIWLFCFEQVVDGKAILPIGEALRPASGRIFPIFLSAVGRHIEQPVDIAQRFATPVVCRVGMEQILTDTEEDTQAMPFTPVYGHLEILIEV